MIDIRKLKELVRLMVVNDLTEIDLRDSQEQVTLKRTGPQVVPQVTHVPVVAAAHAAPAAAPASRAGGGAVATEADVDGDEDLVAIESPMVGTFYVGAGPDKPPFVKPGASVGPETVVCLIEAMKVFNEIKAEVAGTIERVLVKNGEPVEFGQKLMLVRPA
ncbi:MAG: acetyl-CoA carboxylase biotin carboxyl carrier protein [Phycisphaerales bacterium]